METSVQLVPQTYKISEFSNTVTSQSFEAESYEVTPWDMPDLQINVDAALPDEMEVKRWHFDSDVSRNHAFDTNGDLFAGRSYKIAKIDVSENTQTIWTLPTDWSVSGSYASTIGPTGLYYFISNGNLTSLDPDTGIFTQWNVKPSKSHIHSSLDGVYFVPSSSIYITESKHLQITGVIENDEESSIYVYGEGASGLINAELILPSGEKYISYTFADKGGKFRIYFSDAYLSYSDQYYYRGVGNFTIKISDMFQTDEATFEIGSDHGLRGHQGIPTITNEVFLQKLDPNTNTITNFMIETPLYDHRLISHDHDNSLYFSYHAENTYRTSIAKFVPDLNEFTYWTSNPPNEDILSYLRYGTLATSNEKIYWGYEAGRHTTKIVSFDMETGEINETSIPRRCYDDIDGITVDSSDTVYFFGCDRAFYKFDPSTDTFTRFAVSNIADMGEDLFRTNSSDVIYWADDTWMGTATFVSPAEVVSIPLGTSIQGCEENKRCYIPADVLVSVGDVVTWINDDNAAHTVTSGTGQDEDESGSDFDSGLFLAGNAFSFTFDEVGVYPYFCIVHPWKTGSVAVRTEESPTSISISGIETTSSTKIRITIDHELSGSPNVAEFSVSGNTVSDVVLSGVTIMVTLDTPILHSDVITISYSGSFIHSEGTPLDTFVNMAVTNNIVAETDSRVCEDKSCSEDTNNVIEEQESEQPVLPDPTDVPEDGEG